MNLSVQVYIVNKVSVLFCYYCYQHFLPFPQCFQKAAFQRSLTPSETSPGFYMSAVQVI